MLQSKAAALTLLFFGLGGVLLPLSGATVANAAPAPKQGFKCYDATVNGRTASVRCVVDGLTPPQKQFRLVLKCTNGSTRYGSWVNLGGTSSATCVGSYPARTYVERR